MSESIIQASFNAGEWNPKLFARVDLAKYKSGAALLRNFFIDYRGGATTRPGTRYIATSANNDAYPPRLIPFQASFSVTYVLEFGVTSGTGYIAFYNNGAQIISGGSPYTITHPYASSELATLKFVQNVNQLIICHPNHPPYALTLITATNWTMAAISFTPTISAPASVSATTTLAGGSVNYAYVVTSVDANGQESGPSTYATVSSAQDIRSVAGSITVAWTAVTGAVSYNIYKAEPTYSVAVPAGIPFGFIGNATVTSMVDSNIAQNYAATPPIVTNPFAGAGVSNVTVNSSGSYSYSNLPSVTFSAPGGGGTTATGSGTFKIISATPVNYGSGYNVGDTLSLGYGIVLQVTSVLGGQILTVNIITQGSVVQGGAPANPLIVVSTSGSGTVASFNVTWGLATVIVSNPGTGYGSAPTVSFSPTGATATATLGASSSGNPSVPGLFQQRLVLGGPGLNPQQLNFSIPGTYTNFSTTFPVEPDNAITATLVSGQLNTIKAFVVQPQGLIVLSDKQAWLINGGTPGSAISAEAFVANSQAYNGSSDVQPITANDHILYVQSKNSIVRDLAFNFYTQVYTGTDITTLSSHLFYGHQINQWAFAEEPFKVVWAVQNTGTLLALTFLKEQELTAWTHCDTSGLFQSVASVVESTAIGNVDAVYLVVQRTINGASVQYIERFVELNYPNDYKSSWQVDAGIGYNGSPATTFSGATQLAGATVTGVADGVVINFTMPVSGTFVFGPGGTPGLTGIASASIVTVGLPFVPQLQTLALDVGEPTVQGKVKAINAVTTRVAQTLGLSIGSNFNNLVPMQDLIVGNVASTLSGQATQVISGLVTGDAFTFLDPTYTIPGQYCIQQSNPYPASILGVIPEFDLGQPSSRGR